MHLLDREVVVGANNGEVAGRPEAAGILTTTKKAPLTSDSSDTHTDT